MSVEISILLVHIYYTENLNYISILYITRVQSMEALLGGGGGGGHPQLMSVEMSIVLVHI